MMIWIFVELAIILQCSFLQNVYFGLGGFELILVLVLLGIVPRIVASWRGTPDSAHRSKKWDSPRIITASNGSRTATPNAPDRLAPRSRVPFGVKIFSGSRARRPSVVNDTNHQNSGRRAAPPSTLK